MIEATADESGSFTVTTWAPDEREARAMRSVTGTNADNEPFMATASGSISRATAQGRFTEGRALSDGERLLEQESYWSARRTYPTGRFDPAWVRLAAAKDALIPRRIPAGVTSKKINRNNSLLALSSSVFTALGPAPLRMTGCSGFYDYGKTECRVNVDRDRSHDDDPGIDRGLRGGRRRRGLEDHELLQRRDDVDRQDRGRGDPDDERGHPGARSEQPQHHLRRNRRPELRVLLDGQPGNPEVHRRRQHVDGTGRVRFRRGASGAGRPVPAVQRGRQGSRRSQQQQPASWPAPRPASTSYDGGVNWTGPA